VLVFVPKEVAEFVVVFEWALVFVAVLVCVLNFCSNLIYPSNLAPNIAFYLFKVLI
jgi:hypothetical protein